MHTRDNPIYNDIIHDSLTYGGLLKQQFDCDNYVKIEEQRLEFQRNNQVKLRAETYNGLADAINANEQSEAGKYVFLSSSHIGSPRHQYQNYQDAMAMVRKLKKPTLFITFTTNPKWREITENLRPGEQAWMRPDLCSRVFHMKLKEMLHNDIIKREIFGTVIGHVQVIEFQKRGI